MKQTNILIAMLLTSAALMAQTGQITGRLVDGGGNAVAFANVALHLGDSLVGGTVSCEDGNFASEAREGTYRLTATNVGYERLVVRCGLGDLGVLTMNALELKEVEVTASRVTENVDRFVVLPKSEEAEAAGRTLVLLDMLGLPGLKVDVALQSITVDGGLAILQIGGKEVPISRLANLKAENIKRVEYSNNPGIRYLDRGASGIVNIILKEREDGGIIMASANSALTTGFVNGYLQASYHKGKSEFALEYSLGYRDYDSVPYELEDSYLDPARTVVRSQRTNMPFWYISHSLSAEYTYQHDDSTMFVAFLSDDFFSQTFDASGTMTETDRGVTTTQSMQQHSYTKDNLPKLDLYYTHRMPHGQKVELNVVGEYSTNKYDKTLSYWSAGIPPAEYATTVDGHGYALSAEGAYSKRFGNTELRTGLQYQHNFAENDYTLYGVTSSQVRDNAYLYAELAGSLGSKVGYSIGTGAKLLNVSDGENSQRYLRNLSTARLQWRNNPQLSLTLRRHTRPLRPHLPQRRPLAGALRLRRGGRERPVEPPEPHTQWHLLPLRLRRPRVHTHARQLHRLGQRPVLLERLHGRCQLHPAAAMDAQQRGLHQKRNEPRDICAVPPQEPDGHVDVALSAEPRWLQLRGAGSQRCTPLPPCQPYRRQRQHAVVRPHLADGLRPPLQQRREDASERRLRQRYGALNSGYNELLGEAAALLEEDASAGDDAVDDLLRVVADGD